MTHDNRGGGFEEPGRKPSWGRRWSDLRGQESVERLSGPVTVRKIEETHEVFVPRYLPRRPV